MMGKNLDSDNECTEIEVEKNFSLKVEYLEVYAMSGAGVAAAHFIGADLSEKYEFGKVDNIP